MKILYGVQGTGNGHIARAREILPALNKRASVDVLVSGTHNELHLEHPIQYKAGGLGFHFGKNGSFDLIGTWKSSDVKRFFRELEALDLSSYDLVINDFEPVSAWAARKQGVPCVGLSNQLALLDPLIPRPKTAGLGRVFPRLMRHYAPTDAAYALHYLPREPFTFSPLIARECRELAIGDKGHYLVYLPFYSDREIIKALKRFREVQWKVFSKHTKSSYRYSNIDFEPIQRSRFLQALGDCRGVLAAAGFGISSEALFLGKKLLLLPMKAQYEQRFNAHVLKMYFGVESIKSLKRKYMQTIQHWLNQDCEVQVNYKDNAQDIVDQILTDFANQAYLASEASELIFDRGKAKL